jgi:hypothetical protein
MGIVNTGKCPHCGNIVHAVEVDAINVTENFTPAWKGVSFSCSSCHAVLGVGIDPIALKTDIVGELFARLRGKD